MTDEDPMTGQTEHQPDHLDCAQRQLESADGFLRSARHALDRVTGPHAKTARELSEKITRHVRGVFLLQEAVRDIKVPTEEKKK